MTEWLHVVILALAVGIAGADVWRAPSAEPWRARGCLALLVASLALAFVAAAASGDARLAMAAVMTLPLALCAAIFWRRAFGAEADAPLRWPWVAGGAAAVLGIAAAMLLLPLEANPDVWIYHDQRRSTFAVLAGMAMAAAVTEEVVFRGRLLDVLRERVGVAWAVLGTSALFAALHSGTLEMPVAKEAQMFLFGVVAAVVRLRTDLRGAVWVHAVHNAVVLIVHWVQTQGQG